MTAAIVVVADPTKGIKVDAGIIAQPFRDEIKERVRQLNKHGIGVYTAVLYYCTLHVLSTELPS